MASCWVRQVISTSVYSTSAATQSCLILLTTSSPTIISNNNHITVKIDLNQNVILINHGLLYDSQLLQNIQYTYNIMRVFGPKFWFYAQTEHLLVVGDTLSTYYQRQEKADRRASVGSNDVSSQKIRALVITHTCMSTSICIASRGVTNYTTDSIRLRLAFNISNELDKNNENRLCLYSRLHVQQKHQIDFV